MYILSVFFGPSMDMSFNIYDQRLRLIESINHQERVILGCYYDIPQDILVMSGGCGKLYPNELEYNITMAFVLSEDKKEFSEAFSSNCIISSSCVFNFVGVSIWRIKRCSAGSQLETSNSYLVEKIYQFEECTEWVSKLIYEPCQHRAYAISEGSVSILNFRTRKMECIVSDLHETPVTACIWYPRDKFYITSCMNGIVRCWFLKDRSISLHKEKGNACSISSVPVILHTFNAHSKAVTGMNLHPRPGFLVTAGMDACIKVFDLEGFTQVQSFQTADSITNFTLGEFSMHPVCLFAHLSGDLMMWKIGSCCVEFATCSSDIVTLTAFENINEYYTTHESQIKFLESDALGSKVGYGPSKVSESIAASMNDSSSGSSLSGPIIGQDLSISVATLAEDSRSALPNYIVDLNKTVNEKLPTVLSRNASEVMKEEQYDENFKKNNCMVAFAGHDLQILTVTGSMISRCPADSLIDGVTHYTYSMFQQLLFCVLESGSLRVFCTRSAVCVLLREINIGGLSSDKTTALTLVEGLSLGPLRSSHTSKDMRGESSPLNVNEAILIGTANGNLLCLDTFQECALVMTQQISKGPLEELRYRPLRKELLVVLKNSVGCKNSSVKMFQVPDMVLTHSFSLDKAFSCAATSWTESYIVIGCEKGSHHLFKLFDIDEESVHGTKRYNMELTEENVTFGQFVEILHEDADHCSTVTGISFCHTLNSYATSGLDSAVKFWNYRKKCLQTVLLDTPSRDVLFHWPIGHLLVTQREKLHSIPFECWKSELSLEHYSLNEDWDGYDNVPETTPPSSSKAVSRHSGSSKPRTGVTFLTDHDRDEIAEMAFLEAALQSKGNLEDYWRKHSSVGFGGKVRKRSSKSRKKGTVTFDVRNPTVPIPPRRTRSNYFKRKVQKEMEAQLAHTTRTTTPADFNSDTASENSDFDGFNEFVKGSDSDASALEDLVGRREVRGTATAKSLLVRAQSFAMKTSTIVASPETSRHSKGLVFAPGRVASAAESLNNFVATQTVKTDNISQSVNNSMTDHLEGKDNVDELTLFVKPNGPRVAKSFNSRIRAKILTLGAVKSKMI